MENTINFTSKNGEYLTASPLSEGQQLMYEEACRQFKNERAQYCLNVPAKGYNLFKVLLLNQIGIRTATMSELDQIVQEDSDFLKKISKDVPSVVLRNRAFKLNRGNDDKNYSLANTLIKLTGKKEFNAPFVVNGLEIEEDNQSIYGLNFKPGKNFNYFEVPELAHSNDQKKFTKQDERGMPIFDNEGTRVLYTKENGLSRLYMDGDLSLYSWSDDLNVSLDNSKVIVIKPGEKK